LKKNAVVAIVSLLAVLMVLLNAHAVNYPDNNDVWNGKTIRADRSPRPVPLPAPPGSVQTLVADGWPTPPFPPGSAQTLVADGWPTPPFPPGSGETALSV
jgi:hypothetical protein